ncbi:MAG: hypothetical protein WCN92_06920 [Eubacteriales bacterium]
METLPKTADKPAIKYRHFPADYQAVIWRNWGMIAPETIALVLSATLPQITEAAAILGLAPNPAINPAWKTRGYLTIIRNNWHLLTFAQLLTLLGITDAELAFILKEDDFMWHKMGQLKPCVEPPRYRALKRDEKRQTEKAVRIIKEQLGAYAAKEDNAFEFLERYKKPVEPGCPRKADESAGMRTIYSYFALYGDPLMKPELDPFPDALLAEYAETGINGIWLQGLLYQLVPFSFAPEMSKGRERRIASLNQLIKRAKHYGIGVYLYLNEPRAMDNAFFEAHPTLRGEREGDYWAMCTSRPEVQDYLTKGMQTLFESAPDLAGFFTISMSENLTNCFSRAGSGGPKCPICKDRKPWEVVAEVNNLLAKGTHAASPNAKAIAWNWAWNPAWADKVIEGLTQGQIVQCTSEEALKTNIGGVKGRVVDYTISQPGPGEKARNNWRTAKATGHEACAKVQINCTWELAAIPWIPVLDSVEKHIRRLLDEDVRHLQLSWTLGGCPSPNLKLVSMLLSGEGGAADCLKGWLGSELAPIANEAQSMFSKAFAEFPFDIGVAYNAPQNFAPMAPFFVEKTDYKATMVGFPYDDLDGWRSIYPADIFEEQFRRLVDGWKDGLALLRPHLGKTERFDEFARMAFAAYNHFACTLNHIRFVRLRERLESNPGDSAVKAGLLEILADEKALVLAHIKLRCEDSRIGYEASNHYFYSLQDLKEKLLNIWYCGEWLC